MNNIIPIAGMNPVLCGMRVIKKLIDNTMNNTLPIAIRKIKTLINKNDFIKHKGKPIFVEHVWETKWKQWKTQY